MVRAGTTNSKKQFQPTSHTAPEPGQSLNVDLCFVPADHEGEIKLPAVSGSSGRLIVERPGAEKDEKWYPGRVFAREGLSYEDAMAQFAADSRADLTSKPTGCCSPEAAARAEAKTQKAALRQAAEEAKVARRRRRQERQAKDKVWREEQANMREAAERRKKEWAAGQRVAYGSQKALHEARRPPQRTATPTNGRASTGR